MNDPRREFGPMTIYCRPASWDLILTWKLLVFSVTSRRTPTWQLCRPDWRSSETSSSKSSTGRRHSAPTSPTLRPHHLGAVGVSMASSRSNTQASIGARIRKNALTRHRFPTNLVAQSDALVRGEVSDSGVGQPPLLPVEEVVVVGMNAVPQLEAERIAVIRPAALLPPLLPPRITAIPAFRHRELHPPVVLHRPAPSCGIGLAGPRQRVFLFVVVIQVVELVVMPRMTVRV